MGNVGELDQVGLKLGDGTYGTEGGSYGRGLLVNSATFNPGTQTVEPVVEVSGTYDINRVTKGMLNYEATLGFMADAGGDGSGGSIGDFLASLLGTDTGVDEGGGDYSHTFKPSASATPPWLNFWSDKDVAGREYLGFYCTSIKFTISADAGMIPVEVTGIYKTETDYSTGSVTLAFDAEPLLLPSQVSTFSIAGSTVTNFNSCEITLTNETEAFTPLQNDRTISNAYRKNVRANIALTGLNFATETERDKYTGVTALGGSGFIMQIDDSNSNYLKFTFPVGYYTSWEGPNISGSDLKTINTNILATGDVDNWAIKLFNQCSFNYGTGASI